MLIGKSLFYNESMEATRKGALTVPAQAHAIYADVEKQRFQYASELSAYTESLVDGRLLAAGFQDNGFTIYALSDLKDKPAFDLDMFRLDYNSSSCEGGFNLRDGRNENTHWKHVEAVYDIFERVGKRFPNLQLENCASGGGRTDIGIVSRSVNREVPDAELAQAIAEQRRNREHGAGLGIPFAKEVRQHVQAPIGLIVCSHSGTSMAHWDYRLADQGGRSFYGALLRRVRKLGGKVKGCLWYQGESDTGAETAPRYYDAMVSWMAALRKDLNAHAFRLSTRSYHRSTCSSRMRDGRTPPYGTGCRTLN